MNSPRRRTKPLTFGGEILRILLTALGEPVVTYQNKILSPERAAYLEHHKTMTFEDEYRQLLLESGITPDERFFP